MTRRYLSFIAIFVYWAKYFGHWLVTEASKRRFNLHSVVEHSILKRVKAVFVVALQFCTDIWTDRRIESQSKRRYWWIANGDYVLLLYGISEAMPWADQVMLNYDSKLTLKAFFSFIIILTKVRSRRLDQQGHGKENMGHTVPSSSLYHTNSKFDRINW